MEKEQKSEYGVIKYRTPTVPERIKLYGMAGIDLNLMSTPEKIKESSMVILGSIMGVMDELIIVLCVLLTLIGCGGMIYLTIVYYYQLKDNSSRIIIIEETKITINVNNINKEEV